jgi:hypothetical protein
MCLYYASQTNVIVLGTKSGTTRTSVTLPTSYDSTVTKTFEVGGYSKINLSVLYTMGATETSNSIELKIEESPDGTNFYRIPNDNTVGATSTLTAREFTFVGTNAAAATIGVGIDIFYKYLKVSAKETGVVTNAGTIFVEGLLSGK